MSSSKSITAIAIIDMAIRNSKYNSLKSSVNKKWMRYLKNNKLFDEYMVYLANFNAAGAEPKNYKQLAIMCINLSSATFHVDNHHNTIKVNWIKEFKKFAWKSIKWYDIRNILLYVMNNGYLI